ncbi:MAG: hypothetical protein HQM10_07095 [Candidatus Riflebacteria bacterium]|nr:hypothetical protein [Candidatus Riflebacteria bacterium]
MKLKIYFILTAFFFQTLFCVAIPRSNSANSNRDDDDDRPPANPANDPADPMPKPPKPTLSIKWPVKEKSKYEDLTEKYLEAFQKFVKARRDGNKDLVQAKYKEYFRAYGKYLAYLEYGYLNPECASETFNRAASNNEKRPNSKLTRKVVVKPKTHGLVPTPVSDVAE